MSLEASLCIEINIDSNRLVMTWCGGSVADYLRFCTCNLVHLMSSSPRGGGGGVLRYISDGDV